jgi:hypothetical protein
LFHAVFPKAKVFLAQVTLTGSVTNVVLTRITSPASTSSGSFVAGADG